MEGNGLLIAVEKLFLVIGDTCCLDWCCDWCCLLCPVKLISLNMRNEAPALLVSSSGSADGHSLLKPVERKSPWTSSDVQINHDKSRHIQSKSSIAKAGAEPLQELINSIWHS